MDVFVLLKTDELDYEGERTTVLGVYRTKKMAILTANSWAKMEGRKLISRDGDRWNVGGEIEWDHCYLEISEYEMADD